MSTTPKGYKQWAARRRRSDISRQSDPFLLRLRLKVIHLFRRITIALVSVCFRRYRNMPLPDLSQIRSVLIIPNDPIGDLLLSSPLWRKLRTIRPDLHIGIGVSKRNEDIAIHQEGLDAMYDLHSTDLRTLIAEIRRARKQRYDVVMAVAGFYRPTRFAVISRLISPHGFTAAMHDARPERYAKIYSFCKRRPMDPFPQPMVEQYQQFFEQVLSLRFTDAEHIPFIHFDESAERSVSSALAERNIKKFVLINLEAKVPEREFGYDRTIELAKQHRLQFPDYTIILTASDHYWHHLQINDEVIAEGIIRYPTRTINDAAALIRLSSLVISPDTAVVHIAAMYQKPLIAFYPLLDEWQPYRSQAAILIPEGKQPASTIPIKSVLEAAATYL
jgi:ADP-heptose:LPS heptosyltransferase